MPQQLPPATPSDPAPTSSSPAADLPHLFIVIHSPSYLCSSARPAATRAMYNEGPRSQQRPCSQPDRHTPPDPIIHTYIRPIRPRLRPRRAIQGLHPFVQEHIPTMPAHPCAGAYILHPRAVPRKMNAAPRMTRPFSLTRAARPGALCVATDAISTAEIRHHHHHHHHRHPRPPPRHHHLHHHLVDQRRPHAGRPRQACSSLAHTQAARPRLH